MQIYFADYRKKGVRGVVASTLAKAPTWGANNKQQKKLNKRTAEPQSTRIYEKSNNKDAKVKTSYKCAANSTLKIEMKSLRACLNVLKQATDDDKDGIRAYIAECGLTIGLVKRIKPADIENYTQKSKSGSYCPWYVLGALKKAAANGLEDAIKTREAAERRQRLQRKSK